MVQVLDVSRVQEGAKSVGTVLEDSRKKAKTRPSGKSCWNKVSTKPYKLDIVLDRTY